MATSLPTPVHTHCIQHSKSTKEDGWLLLDLSFSLCGNIAVTGYNKNTHRTSIDVYSSVRNSESRDKPKIFYSKEFGKYESEGSTYWLRCVSFVDSHYDNRDLVVATGLGDILEVFDLNQDRVLKSRRVTLVNHGGMSCLSVREREIFIGFLESNKITVYDVIDLNENKSIILQGIQDGYCPGDMTPLKGTLYVCVGHGSEESNHRSLIFDEKSGKILSELTKPTHTRWYTSSVTMCVPLGVVAVVWSQTYGGTTKGSDVIAFYSLFGRNNSSFLIVEIEAGVSRIRITDRGDRMVTRNHVTGEVKVYDMANIFTYNRLKTNLASQLQSDDCLRLAGFFVLPKDQTDATLKSDKPTENFLLTLENTGLLQPANVDRLAEALTELKISSSCSSLVDFYQNTRTSAFSKKSVQKLQEEINVLQVKKQQIAEKLETANNRAEESMTEVQKLQTTLEETEKRLQETQDLHQEDLGSSQELQDETEKSTLQMKELLEKATQQKQAIRAELEQYKLQSSMESMTLEEVAAGGNVTAATTKMQSPKVTKGSRDSAPLPSTEYQRKSAIEDEFPKLLVKLSVKLSSDHCILLANYFDFPESKIDLIRKENGTPGVTLLGIMKERSIINMYDVTKLQQALVDIELLEVNESLLKPYQSWIASSVYEQHD